MCFFFLFLFLSLEKLSDAWGSGSEKTLLNVLNCLLLFLPDIFDCNRNNKSRSFRCLKLCPYRSREFVVRHKRKVEEKQKEQFRLPMMLQWMQVGRQPFFVLKTEFKGRVWGQEVSGLAFYFDDSSSNPAEVDSFIL